MSFESHAGREVEICCVESSQIRGPAVLALVRETPGGRRLPADLHNRPGGCALWEPPAGSELGRQAPVCSLGRPPGAG